MLELSVLLAVFVLGVIVGRPAPLRGRGRYPRTPTKGPLGPPPRPPNRPTSAKETVL